ncbi:hypothetical protein THAOC_16995 [Thalassiosira oceanica]|uniref:Uncharacterized protein n=1 Tax=Thalassiosira oceanica TaxID=159749 RepID=K0SN69_THAOC|nr:hypothetical protein THAOC_16995 [Thalassiosira oceanica]|eukprot:EJK62396.1 hypothetical protein THAOC_16995 [Thalassiosira oceanica]
MKVVKAPEIEEGCKQLPTETWATGGSGAAAQMDELLSCSEGGQKWKNEGIIGEDDSDEGVEDPLLQHYQRWHSPTGTPPGPVPLPPRRLNDGTNPDVLEPIAIMEAVSSSHRKHGTAIAHKRENGRGSVVCRTALIRSKDVMMNGRGRGRGSRGGGRERGGRTNEGRVQQRQQSLSDLVTKKTKYHRCTRLRDTAGVTQDHTVRVGGSAAGVTQLHTVEAQTAGLSHQFVAFEGSVAGVITQLHTVEVQTAGSVTSL